MLAVRLSEIDERLDQQSLKVTNLSAPRYALKIDGLAIGEWTKEQLAAGINLALLPTPMLTQAMAVHDLTVRHARMHFVRWRDVQVAFARDDRFDVTKALAALDALEAELIKQQRAAARPQARRYELIPQP